MIESIFFTFIKNELSSIRTPLSSEDLINKFINNYILSYIKNNSTQEINIYNKDFFFNLLNNYLKENKTLYISYNLDGPLYFIFLPSESINIKINF